MVSFFIPPVKDNAVGNNGALLKSFQVAFLTIHGREGETIGKIPVSSNVFSLDSLGLVVSPRIFYQGLNAKNGRGCEKEFVNLLRSSKSYIISEKCCASCYSNSDFWEDFLVKSLLQLLRNVSMSCSLSLTIIYIYVNDLTSREALLFLSVLSRLDSIKRDLNVIWRNNQIYEIKVRNLVFRNFSKFFSDLSEIRELVQFDPNNLVNPFVEKFCLHQFCSILQDYVAISLCFYYYKVLIRCLLLLRMDFGLWLVHSRSISSVSFMLFRSRFLNDANTLANSNYFDSDILDLVKSSYRGGIIDVYKPFGEGLFQYDINSSYPFAMLNKMPVGWPRRVSKKRLQSLDINNFFGFVTVEIDVSEDTYVPFLGIKDGKTGSIIYPVGVFVVSVFSEELKHALRVNNIKVLQVIRAVRFSKRVVFNKFVKRLFKLRFLKSDGVLRKIFYKNLLNFLYGRMGLKSTLNGFAVPKSKSEQILSSFLFNTTEIVSNHNYFGVVVSDEDLFISSCLIDKLSIKPLLKESLKGFLNMSLLKKKRSYSCLQIAACITSYARINIDMLKRYIINKKGLIYYSDTDSVVTDLGPCHIKTSDNIGDLKLVDRFRWGCFLAPKIYFAETDSNGRLIRFRGVNREHARAVFNEIDFLTAKKLLSFSARPSFTCFDIHQFRPDLAAFSVVSGGALFYLVTNKRVNVFDKHLFWVDTKPIKLPYSC